MTGRSESPDNSTIQSDKSLNTASNTQSISDDVTSACIKFVEKYRSGESDKVDAIVGLTSTLNRYASGKENEDELVRQALQSYVGMLDNHDAIRGRTAERPTDLTRSNEQADPENVEEPANNRRDDSEHTASHPGHHPSSKRERSPESDDGSDNPNPKRHIDPGQFAWIIHDELEPVVLSLELQKTQKMLENFSRDLKFANVDGFDVSESDLRNPNKIKNIHIEAICNR
ncbi:hypothetical protein BDN70DRAFT_869082 [Pholiota conissans]|uniref:Uncharacterized protein n=1 Tax=Pholiota conissans TaxID=109636 RepID=A0A9P6CME2_9AGAR|nr:hypothetical protein BDN70DRAFT_869082 [Pholiota conissans]